MSSIQEPQRYLDTASFYRSYSIATIVADFIVENDCSEPTAADPDQQPWLNQERMWSMDDIGAARYEIRDPLRIRRSIQLPKLRAILII